MQTHVHTSRGGSALAGDYWGLLRGDLLTHIGAGRALQTLAGGLLRGDLLTHTSKMGGGGSADMCRRLQGGSADMSRRLHGLVIAIGNVELTLLH